MGFGQTAAQEQKKQEKTTTTTSEGEIQAAWPYIPLRGGHEREIKGGIRKVRFLPKIENGLVVEVPRTNRAGKVIGKVGVTDSEVRFIEVWWKFNTAQGKADRRIWLDWTKRFDNAWWEYVKPYGKGSKEWQSLKEQFAINVVDKSLVIFDANGYPVYTDEKGLYVINAFGKRMDKPIDGDVQPLNQVRILQGTSGRTDPPGRHFFQQFYSLIGTFEDGDGVVRELHEYDLMIKITGADLDTVRAVTPQSNFNPLPDELILAPRYDLASWCIPWPDAAIEELLSGYNYEEVAANYSIVLNPVLKPVVSADDVPFDESVPAEETKEKRSRRKVTEESEELFA